MNKKNKLKFENIKPNKQTDFENCYKIATQQIANLQSTLQQLAAAYKSPQIVGDDALIVPKN